MLSLDTTVNTIANMDYKFERMSTKQDETISIIQKIVENQLHDPLLTSITTRGVLSTLKIIERKLDKLQMQYSTSQSLLAKQILDNKRKSEMDLEKGKVLVRCNTTPKVEELLSDVASKVDVMFDKFTGPEESSGDYSREEQKDSTEVGSQESKYDPDLKLIRGLLKRLNQPCKRTVRVLETLDNNIKNIDNTTLSIQEDGKDIQNYISVSLERHENNMKNLLKKSEEIINRFDEFTNELNYNFSNEQEVLASHFKEQREHITGIIQTGLKNNIKPHYEKPQKPIFEQHPQLTTFTTIKSNKSNCQDLRTNDNNGVYEFENVQNFISNTRNYNIRKCEVSKHLWWTVIQQRGTNPMEQNFTLSWNEYKTGFGSLDKDFWFGNEFIHELTNDNDHILRIELEDFNNRTVWAEYSLFKVLSEGEKYKLILGRYSGNASDSFSAHNNSFFSTYDHTNDFAPECCPCAPAYGGGWWFYSCFEANLNGVYYKKPTGNDYFKGLIWEHWLGNYSLKKTKMMIRPVTETDFEITEIITEEIPEDP